MATPMHGPLTHGSHDPFTMNIYRCVSKQRPLSPLESALTEKTGREGPLSSFFTSIRHCFLASASPANLPIVGLGALRENVPLFTPSAVCEGHKELQRHDNR